MPLRAIVSPGSGWVDHLRLAGLSHPLVTLSLSAVGAATVLSVASRVMAFFYTHWSHRSALARYRHASGTAPSDVAQEAQAWALVTGATNGIGLGFAHELASHGFNLLLHGRSAAKLAAVEKELQQAYPAVAVQTVQIDASTFSPDQISSLAFQAENLPGPLTLLVNNVGGMPAGAAYSALVRCSPDFLDQTLSTNLRFTVQVTRALLALLTKHSPAAIINIGSVAGQVCFPLLVPYSTAKAGLVGFTRGLARECRFLTSPVAVEGTDAPVRAPVEVKGMLVGAVATSSFKDDKPSLNKPGPRALARSALHKLGLSQDMVAPWWMHDLQFHLISLLGSEKTMMGKFVDSVRHTTDWEQRLL